MIYRNFDHWFSTSEIHGFSSSSRDFAKDLWEDLRPTMEASLDDYKQGYLELSKEKANNNSELVTGLLDYIKEHKKENDPTFWKWWMDKANGKVI